MSQEWLIEVLTGAGKLFLNPVFYYLFFLAAFLGVSRVKRERKNFHIRSENAYFELKQLTSGILVGLAISIFTVILGIALPIEAVVFIVLLTFVWSFTLKFRLLSPVYTLGFSFFLTIIALTKGWKIPYFSHELLNVKQGIFPSMAVLLSLMIIGEGVLIMRNGRKGTSPKLKKSKRGQIIGVHEVKRLWMVPIFLFVPFGGIEAPFEWWPVFSIGNGSYYILLVPFMIGFHQQIQGQLPSVSITIFGKRIMAFGILIALLTIIGYWYPVASIGVVAIAIIGRELLSLRQRIADESLPVFFSKKNNGLMILGIIPDSPASKMDLQVGELITKANGFSVQKESEFYEALQHNGAYCKLEVLDVNGQIRFVQRALYEGDHHELGILFVQDEKKWGHEAV
ncbi:PDZ domain-containing protein [Bacillus sp. 03113]|uniref:PDZ domain-containing protein n=1 Tax=Bacillus sp. 03113 TaxID=2578211 RepID=UPI0011423E24|nr:PDZ domain-containing protein [Bacillus sp. 03113]